jgi:adenine/guanine phosphoribosyltransferase-like PRPP-binding protein
METHAGYLRPTLNSHSLRNIVDCVSDCIEKRFPEIDYIAGMGISGMAVLPGISYKSGKDMFIVRKEDDINNHSYEYYGTTIYRDCEFIKKDKENPTAVIIDDLVASGKSLERMIEILKKNKIKVIAVLLYFRTDDDEDSTVDDHKGESFFALYPVKIYSKDV